jgi:peroxiredoxin
MWPVVAPSYGCDIDRKEDEMRSKGWVRFAVAACVLAAGLSACSPGDGQAGPAAAESLVGSVAPALSGAALMGDGRIDLRSMTGKPTVVAFWLYACPHCIESIPALQQAWDQAAPDANILTVGMAYDDPSTVDLVKGYGSPQEFVATTGLTLPSLAAKWSSEETTWKLEQTPTVFVLDANHVVRNVFVGPTDPSAILDALETCSSGCAGAETVRATSSPSP